MTQWKFDEPHCFIEFSVRHWGVAWVKGRFSGITGTVTFDEADLEHGAAEVEVDTQTIWTGNEMRDKHLKSADFFDVEHFTKATFKTTGVGRMNDDTFAVTGNLTIKESTKPITIVVEYTKAQEVPAMHGGTEVRAGFTGKTTINRHDFGLDWDAPGIPGGVSMIGGEVDLTIGVEAIRQ